MNLNYFYLIAAIIFLFSGHLLRLCRWQMFIRTYEKPQFSNLAASLCVGYFSDFILPFHLGDVLRAIIAGRRMKNGYSFSIVTVIIDRYLDVIFVGLVFVILSTLGFSEPVVRSSSFFYVSACVALIAGTVIIFFASNFVKSITKFLASIFNEDIEYHILSFVFSAIKGFKDLFLHLSKLKVTLLTTLMWGSYILSYYLYARFTSEINPDTTLLKVFVGLFGSAALKGNINDMAYNQIIMIAFMLIPLIMLAIVSFIKKGEAVSEASNMNILPQLKREERLKFLEEYFSNNNRDYLSDYLEFNKDVAIIEDFSAGSKATTMLCAKDGETFFRKFAFSDAGKKLYEQKQWLEANAELPVAAVIFEKQSESAFMYDMPYIPGAVTLFEYVHYDIGKGFEILKRVMSDLDASLYKKSIDADVDSYIKTKVIDNLSQLGNIRKFSRLSDLNTIVINGKEYNNLKHYKFITDEEYLKQVFSEDKCSFGHGDLTLENIIVKPDGEYYLIDPNECSLLSGRNSDLGKVLQSLHSGYEFLRLVKSSTVKGNRIDFFLSTSFAYHAVYDSFKEYLEKEYALDDLRSIYMHEIVHFIRLLPYRISSPDFAVFYSAFIMLLSEYDERFIKER